MLILLNKTEQQTTQAKHNRLLKRSHFTGLAALDADGDHFRAK